MLDKKIRVAIVGLGNCASSLIQGIEYYKQNEKAEIDGLMQSDIGGYGPTDIEVVLAFDVDERKVGKPIGEAIYAKPNCAMQLVDSVDNPRIVQLGKQLDGVSGHMLQHPANHSFRPAYQNKSQIGDIVSKIQEADVDILINYLPVGSQEATEFYAQCAIDANVAFLNCIPVFIASNPEWEQKFIDADLPLIGDDMKSQFGASIVSQMLQELAFARGHKVKCHIQRNVGGNTDFLNMENKDRLASKKVSKENVIRSQNDIHEIDPEDSFLHAGPSEYISYYKDNKVANFRLELEGFGGAPVIFDAQLSVQDSPNSAGVVIDAIRYLKVAREMGIVGALRGPSAFTQKTPPMQMTFSDAKYECETLAIREYSDLTRKQVQSKIDQ